MFKNYRAYAEFGAHIRLHGRYGLDKKAQTFLSTFRRGLGHRTEVLKRGHILYRAVRGIEECYGEKQESYGYSGVKEDRIFPKRQYAYEGRVNPTGIVVLYLASSHQTAISEIRPWIGEQISIAGLKIKRNLRIANLSKGYGKSWLNEISISEFERFDFNKMPPEKANNCVWHDIDNSFSRPVTRTDTGAEYAITQILAEAVKSEGFDGLFYKSSFGGETGYNIALFNLDDAEVAHCIPFTIKDVEVRFDRAGAGWSKKS